MDLFRSDGRRTMEAVRAREINVGFFEGAHFDEGAVAVEDRLEAMGVGGVVLGVAAQKDCVRAEPIGVGNGHGRVDPVGACFVGGSSNHATASGISTDNDGLAHKARVEQALD